MQFSPAKSHRDIALPLGIFRLAKSSADTNSSEKLNSIIRVKYWLRGMIPLHARRWSHYGQPCAIRAPPVAVKGHLPINVPYNDDMYFVPTAQLHEIPSPTWLARIHHSDDAVQPCPCGPVNVLEGRL